MHPTIAALIRQGYHRYARELTAVLRQANETNFDELVQELSDANAAEVSFIINNLNMDVIRVILKGSSPPLLSALGMYHADEEIQQAARDAWEYLKGPSKKVTREEEIQRIILKFPEEKVRKMREDRYILRTKNERVTIDFGRDLVKWRGRTYNLNDKVIDTLVNALGE